MVQVNNPQMLVNTRCGLHKFLPPI